MKHKKSFLNKFRRKYLFLQNSLSDFLHWRTSDFSTANNSLLPENFQKKSQRKVYLFAEDKISLQEYWKSSEKKKIANSIQNMNKESKISFLFEEQKTAKGSKENIPPKNSPFFSNEEMLNKKGEKNSRQFFEKSFPQKNNENSNFFRFPFYSSNKKWQKAEKKRKNRDYSPLFRLKKRMSSGQKKTHSNVDTLIPKSDLFQKVNSFPFFLNSKIGRFFPKKKNFQQYWIFPVLGFVVLFSSPSSLFDFQKKTKTTLTSLKFSSFLENKKYQKDFFDISYKQSFPKTKASFLQVFLNGSTSSDRFDFLNQSSFQSRVVCESLPFLKNEQQKHSDMEQVFDFAYSDVVSRETYKQLQKLEKNEFQRFCHFYLNFFGDSMCFFLDEKPNEIFKKSFSHSWNKNSTQKNILRQTIATKRNIFSWKWFSLNSNSFAFEQKKKFSKVFLFEIPQKAQFFFPKDGTVEKSSFFPFCSSNKKKNKCDKEKNPLKKGACSVSNINFSSKRTPVFDFAKSRFLFNELERNLATTPDVFYLESGFFAQTFEKNQPSLASFSSFPFERAKNDENALQTFGAKKSKFQLQNLIFLQKWLQTQNFLDVRRKTSNQKVFSPFFGTQGTFLSNDSIKGSNLVLFPTKNFVVDSAQPLSQTQEKILDRKNLMKLDSLYLQKIFGFFGKRKALLCFFESKNNQMKNQSKKNKNLNFFNSFSTFSQFKNTQISENFEENFEDLTFVNKQNPLSLKLKKHTFEFFVFQYYNNNFKNFLKPSIFTTKNDFPTFFHQKQNSFESLKKRKALFEFFENSRTNKKFLAAFVRGTKKIRALAFSNGTKAPFCLGPTDAHFFEGKKEENKKEKSSNSFSLNSFVSKRKILSSTSFRVDKNVEKFDSIFSDDFKENEKNGTIMLLNPSFRNSFLKNRISEKKNSLVFDPLFFSTKKQVSAGLENRMSYKPKTLPNFITNLELPILLDFSNRKNFRENFHLKGKNLSKHEESFGFGPKTFGFFPEKWRKNSFLKKDLNSLNFSSKNLESHQSHQLSSYFVMNSNGIHSFFKSSNFSELFASKKQKIQPFSCSKTDFFDTLYENTLKNLKKNFFWVRSTLSFPDGKERNIEKFQFFKKYFWLENAKNEQPFVFKTHSFFVNDFLSFEKGKTSNALFQNLQKSSQDKNFKTLKINSFFLKSTKSFVLKQRFFVSNRSKGFFFRFSKEKPGVHWNKTNLKKYKKDFSNFQSRRFEKVFQTFFSPLNKENFDFSAGSSNFHLTDKNRKREKQKKAFLKFKIQKDSLLLQTLSTSLQNQYKKPNLPFFISSNSQTNGTKSLLLKNEKEIKALLLNKSDSILFLNQQKNFQSLRKTPASVLKKNSIAPTFILKRDGFVFLPKSQFFKNVHIENQKQESSVQSTLIDRFNHSRSNQKERNARLEKEKSLQKKRRLKKQKLETRRRKKRKRFFPRPVWLRFHLYKKFLKSRHPEKFSRSTFLKSQTKETPQKNQQSIFSSFLMDRNQQAVEGTNNASAKRIFVFPFCSSHKKCFTFSCPAYEIENPKRAEFEDFENFSKDKKLSLSFGSFQETRWKNVFESSFFRTKNSRKNNKIGFLRQQNLKTNQKDKKIYSFMNISTSDRFNSFKSQNQFVQKKIYRKNRQKWGFYWKNGLEEKILYKKFPQLNKKTNVLSGFHNSSISQNKEHYKISGEILSEFLRLSWKSYWFQTNFIPYTRRITENFKKMQQLQSQKNLSEYNLFDFRANIPSTALFRGFPPFQRNITESSQNDLILKKSIYKKFFWYCNIRTSLESNSIVRDSFLEKSKTSVNFQKIQNFPEYNRILYSRVSEILRNFKSSEFNDENFLRETQKNLKTPRHKNEPISSNSSFFTKSALFYENFNVPSQPFIPAFSMFSSLFHNRSIKPTGELPTLRALWALQQTNFYHFQERNALRNLWTLKKRTESLKSFKGAKQLVTSFRKYSGLEKLNAPKLLKPLVLSLSDKNLPTPQSSEHNYGNDYKPQIVKKENVFFPEKLAKRKYLFLSTVHSGFSDFVQQLDTMCLQKFMNVQQKCSVFGINNFKQNSKISLRYLKFHLLSIASKENFYNSFAQDKSFSKTSSIDFPFFHSSFSYPPARKKGKNKDSDENGTKAPQQGTVDHNFTRKTQKEAERFPNQQNSAKSSLNFWWAQKNFMPFELFFSSQNKSLADFDVFQFFEFLRFSDEKPSVLRTKTKQDQQLTSLFLNSQHGMFEHKQKNSNFLGIESQFVWFAALLFHIAIFFSLFKLPEIRSVLKFQCLVFYKFFNGFFTVVFAIYNLCQKYTNGGTIVAKKILQTCSSFSPKENSRAFRSNLINFDELQIFALKSKPAAFPYFSSSSSNFSLMKANVFGQAKNKDQLQKKKGYQEKTRFSLHRKKALHQRLFLVPKKDMFLLKTSFFFDAKKEVSPFSSYGQKKTPKSLFFEVFLRLSKFSYISFSEKTSFFEQKQRILSFYISQKKSMNNFFVFKNISFVFPFCSSNKKRPPFIFSSNIKKDQEKNQVSYGPKRKNHQFSSKMIEGVYLQKQKVASFFRPEGQKKPSSNSAFRFDFDASTNSFRNSQSHLYPFKNIQTLSITENFICKLALSFLLFGKSATLMSYNFVRLSSNLSSKILDLVETVMFSIYKFLEKPAELMIEWIALIFLIEWSSDIATFVPDTLDIALAKSSQKFYRPLRSGSLVLSFFTTKNDFLVLSFSSIGATLPSTLLHSFEFLTYSNIASFTLQKRFLYFFENFSSVLVQPDMDIFVRQRKGMIFWDIWAEILLKAAEKYNVNIPSFVTLKEEQELFIERLLQDRVFLRNLRVEKTKGGLFEFPFTLSNNSWMQAQKNENNFGVFHSEMLQQKSSASFIENFLVKERSQNFSNFVFLAEKKKMKQLSLFALLDSSAFDAGFNFSNKNKASFFKPNQLGLSFSFLFSKQKATKGAKEKNSLQQNLSPFFKKSLTKRDVFQSFSNDSFDFEKFTSFDRWSCHQYGTYQGPETDLFVDIHPPKSLKHIQFFKYYEPAQYTLGSLICQIYSGVFSKQISKNILVIGSPGTAKTLFIQALAGETEMKIITDNAYRYSMVQRGVAVGMKYLRDVFDALALQTPCFFLMEHIHVIGSKRPLLISDDENVKGIQSSFGLDQQEVHETNQMIYQLNRHSISDYKRPYKGDFSMSIPTNFFLQNFYSNSEKTYTSIFKNSQFSAGGVNSVDRTSPTSPLPIESIEHSLLSGGLAEKEKTDTAFQNSFDNTKKGNFSLQSRLQISKEQIFAPPATSPFTILMMKEQKKLKPKKIVQENSWGGLSADQMISYQKENSSVRAKVAVLADITMNLSRGKFDMITDLLVIIDSVRSNRGFVVFATTHLPSLLDPALRRPGRFDETISLAQSPNFLNRFEILKMHFENSLTTLDFLDSSILTENFSEMNLLNLITGTKLSFFHQYKYTSAGPKATFCLQNKKQKLQALKAKISKFRKKPLSLNSQKQRRAESSLPFSDEASVQGTQKRIVSQINPSKAFHSFLKSSFFHDLYLQEGVLLQKNNQKKIVLSKGVQSFHSSKYFLRDSKLFKYTILPKGPSHTLSLAYSKIGIFLAKATLLNDPTSFVPLTFDTNSLSSAFSTKNQSFFGNAFYDSQKQQKIQLMVFLSGKISEFFIQKNTKTSFTASRQREKFFIENANSIEDKSGFALNNRRADLAVFESPFELFTQKFSIFLPQKIQKRQKIEKFLTKQEASRFNTSLKEFDKFLPVFSNEKTSAQRTENKKIESSFGGRKASSEKQKASLLQKNDFFWTAFGNNSMWRSATPFLFSILQKRFLFTKNLLLSKMLFFDNKNQRKQPPSPPSSSILMPSKKYENFKRIENDFVQKARFSINEKIQMHQQQRFLKQLYNIPVQQYFRSEMIENRKTFFSSSFQELAYLDSFTRRSSSSHFYHRKYLGIRHRFSNVNQWWNGFLPEHNTETTYLSDVDWRTMFGTSPKIEKRIDQLISSSPKQPASSEKSINQTFEFTMDFPDAEQYYNPRNRRWYFNGKSTENFLFSPEGKTSMFRTKKNSSYWLTFDITLQYEIYYHYLMQSFHETFQFFDKNREMLDFFVFHLLRKGFLKELDYLTTISRFQNLKRNF